MHQLEQAAVAIRAAIEALDSLGLYDYRERAQRNLEHVERLLAERRQALG